MMVPPADRAAIVWTCGPDWAKMPCRPTGEVGMDAEWEPGAGASASTKNPDLPDTYYLGRLAAPNTIDTVPEKTLLAFADHGSLDDRLEPDYAAAERAIAAAADAGIDADALAEHLQRHGAGAFTADWAALLTAIKEKAAKLTQHTRCKMDEGSS